MLSETGEGKVFEEWVGEASVFVNNKSVKAWPHDEQTNKSGVSNEVYFSPNSERMAYWVDVNWLIDSERDLDEYTFNVAGAVGVLLSELWIWYDKTPSRKLDAISYGRGLQAVNILRNRTEDLRRGVDFFPRAHAATPEHRHRRAPALEGVLQ